MFKDSENNFCKIHSTSMKLYELASYNNQLFSDSDRMLYILYDVILLNLHFLYNYYDPYYAYFTRATNVCLCVICFIFTHARNIIFHTELARTC